MPEVENQQVQQVQGTEGHESEAINVSGLKATMQKLKTDVIEAPGFIVQGGVLCQTWDSSLAASEEEETTEESEETESESEPAEEPENP